MEKLLTSKEFKTKIPDHKLSIGTNRDFSFKQQSQISHYNTARICVLH